MKKGFTLIELIVAVTIMIIVTSIGTIAYNEVIQSSRDSRRKQDLKKLSEALEIFKARTGRYPVSGINWLSSEPGNVQPNNGGDWIPGLAASGLVPELPRDPLGGPGIAVCTATNANWRRGYLYLSTDGTRYKLLAHCSAENPQPDANVVGQWSRQDPFFDPIRPDHAWAVYSDNVSRGW